MPRRAGRDPRRPVRARRAHAARCRACCAAASQTLSRRARSTTWWSRAAPSGGMIEFEVHVDGAVHVQPARRRPDRRHADRLDRLCAVGRRADPAPALPALLLVPVAPHALSNRPIVLPDDCEIEIEIIERGAMPRAHFDMQTFARARARRRRARERVSPTSMHAPASAGLELLSTRCARSCTGTNAGRTGGSAPEANRASMLRSLSIRDFVIVDALELEFAAGFTVLTGETGAGKSILIDALALALGGRADADVVREGAARADIAAEFRRDRCRPTAWLARNDFAATTARLLLRRVVDAGGRSRAYINGVAATVAQLRELGEMLVDIHGQHAHQSLLKPAAQRALLDAPWRPARRRRWRSAAAHADWRAPQRAARRTRAQRRRVHGRAASACEWQVATNWTSSRRKPASGPRSGRARRLAHAASLLEGAQAALEALAEADEPVAVASTALSASLRRAGWRTTHELQPVLDSLERRPRPAQDAVYALQRYLDRVDLDPARGCARSKRASKRSTLPRASCACQPDELPAIALRNAAPARRAGGASDLGALQRARSAALEAATWGRPRALSKRAGQGRQGDGARGHARDAGPGDGRRQLRRRAAAPASRPPRGLERVEFLVAGHAGAAPRPLAKVASGGELARIALAIAVIAATATPVPTLIFDEVDAGIGGAVAEIVGRLLQRLGQRAPGAVRDAPAAGRGARRPASAGRQGNGRLGQDGVPDHVTGRQRARRGTGAHARRHGHHRHHPQARARKCWRVDRRFVVGKRDVQRSPCGPYARAATRGALHHGPCAEPSGELSFRAQRGISPCAPLAGRLGPPCSDAAHPKAKARGERPTASWRAASPSGVEMPRVALSAQGGT